MKKHICMFKPVKLFIWIVMLLVLQLINIKPVVYGATGKPDIISFSRYLFSLDKQFSRDLILSQITGKKYYLDPVKGNDKTGDGSAGKPWKTLKKAFFTVRGGDGVILRSGHYGDFVEWKRTIRKKYVVYINDIGAKPVFNQIKIRYRNYKPLAQAYYIFSGITIKPKWVDPASSGKPGSTNPMYTKATSYTYNKTALPVDILNATKIRLYNCHVIGTNKYLTGGVTLKNARDISIVRCEIHRVVSGIVFTRSQRINIYNNHVYDIIGSHIQDGGYSSNINIEANYAHDRHWSPGDKYAPRIKRYFPHGSFVSIRSSNFIIRNNIFHDGGESSGIMLYLSFAEKSYHNILIENNLIFDVHNNFVIRLYRVGSNIVIRNNTILGRGRNTNFGARRHNVALALHSVAPGYSGSGLYLYNNIFVGSVILDKWAGTVTENNNIFWSVIIPRNKFYKQSDLISKSRIVTSGRQDPSFFKEAFFKGKFTTKWPNMKKKLEPGVRLGHSRFIDFRLHANSPAKNFGDPATQPRDSLGSLVNGFIIDDGIKRTQKRHSAGCYE